MNRTVVDLGSAPPSNAYLTEQSLHAPEKWYPLRLLVCGECWLVQTEGFADADELFSSDYAYFSSFSTSWLRHCADFVGRVSNEFSLSAESHVVEVAANDGYLLQYFKQRGIPSTGIEPTSGTAAAARQKGIDIVERFFGVDLAGELVSAGKQADLTIANNVLAHVPDIDDFVSGFSILLKPDGVATFEFPHLLRLLKETQFDTIYHEHFSYLSLSVVERIFSANGMSVFDVEELTTHGGSLRVFAQRSDTGQHERSTRVRQLLRHETDAGLMSKATYESFQTKVERCKDRFLSFLLEAKHKGKQVAAYGAAAKGNTFLNYAGIRPDLVSFVVDKNPVKQGKFMPGSRIPICAEERLRQQQPDYVVILPWNLCDEIVGQLAYVENWGGQLVTAVPSLEFHSGSDG